MNAMLLYVSFLRRGQGKEMLTSTIPPTRLQYSTTAWWLVKSVGRSDADVWKVKSPNVKDKAEGEETSLGVKHSSKFWQCSTNPLITVSWSLLRLSECACIFFKI